MLQDKNLKKDVFNWLKKGIICTASIVLLGVATVLAVRAMLGNDPISVLYDGLGVSTKINMGIAANIINCILALVVFFLDRKYIHVGTVIYALVLGSSITLGLNFYDSLNLPGDLLFRIFIAIAGYLLAFVALGAFVAIDIGVDPWTAAALMLSKKIQKPFSRVRIIIDTSALIIGWFLGGTVGVMTLVAAIVAGPVIQKVAEFLDKIFSKVLE